MGRAVQLEKATADIGRAGSYIARAMTAQTSIQFRNDILDAAINGVDGVRDLAAMVKDVDPQIEEHLRAAKERLMALRSPS
jgi:hypothetical protein